MGAHTERGRDVEATTWPSLDLSRELGKRLQRPRPWRLSHLREGRRPVPERLRPIMERGSGCHVWDVDGNEFIEYGMGLRAVTLGHAYPESARRSRRSWRWARTSCVRRPRARGRRALPGAHHARRDGQVHEGRLDREHRGGEARSGVHGPRPRRDLRRASVLLVRRLGDGDDARRGASRRASRSRR